MWLFLWLFDIWDKWAQFDRAQNFLYQHKSKSIWCNTSDIYLAHVNHLVYFDIKFTKFDNVALIIAIFNWKYNI